MGESYLEELIEEATIDCYDEYEAFGGMHTKLTDEIEYPFEATILGERVKILSISEKSSLRRGILIEFEKQGKMYTFPMSELNVNELTDDTANWVAAYQHWANHY